MSTISHKSASLYNQPITARKRGPRRLSPDTKHAAKALAQRIARELPGQGTLRRDHEAQQRRHEAARIRTDDRAALPGVGTRR